MKANHNKPVPTLSSPCVVINISKIQNESKSQLLRWGNVFHSSCYQYFKDTK